MQHPNQAPQSDSQGSGNIETVTDAERGCGFLKEGKAYLRSEVDPNGILPPFVGFESPIAFLEGSQRGYTYFPGLQFELTRCPTSRDYERAVAGDDSHREVLRAVSDALDVTAVRDARESLDVLQGVTPESESDYKPRAVDPPLEVHRHVERLKRDMDRPGDSGAHIGEMRVARSHDLLMWVGETYYPEPADFISECKAQGLSKAIPTSANQEPPVINPGRTRVFLVHPNAIETGTDDDGAPTYIPGVIGYAYVTRVIYTGIDSGDGVDFPGWAQEYAENGYFDLVRIGEKVPKATRENGSTLEDWAGENEPDAEAQTTGGDGEYPAPESVQASDKPGRDVEAAPEERPEDHNMPALEDDGEPDVDFDSEGASEAADDEELREALMGLPFQLLREKANERGLNPGQNPRKEQVVDALIEDGAASLVGGDE